jgi:excisionase family DNA binding protein
MDTKIYTPKQAWEKLGIGRTRFYQLLAEGKIRCFKNGRRYLIPVSAIDAFIQEQTAKSVKAGEQ